MLSGGPISGGPVAGESAASSSPLPLSSLAGADVMRYVFPAGAAVIGFEQITVSSAVKTLTVANYQSQLATGERLTARKALISVAGDAIRVRIDGTDPASGTGHLIGAGDDIELNGQAQIQAFKAIRETSDATIAVTYFT